MSLTMVSAQTPGLPAVLVVGNVEISVELQPSQNGLMRSRVWVRSGRVEVSELASWNIAHDARAWYASELEPALTTHVLDVVARAGVVPAQLCPIPLPIVVARGGRPTPYGRAAIRSLAMLAIAQLHIAGPSDDEIAVNWTGGTGVQDAAG